MSPEAAGRTELDDANWPGDDRRPDDADPGWPGGETREPGRPGGETREPLPDWDDAGDERDPDWPDDWPDDDGEDPPWRRAAPPAAHGQDGGPGRRGHSGLRPLALAIVAVVALAAGAGVALAIVNGLDRSSSPSAAPSAQPPALAPGGSNGGGTIPGGGGGGGGAVEEMFVAGPVTAVSSTSITIGGPGHTVTAAITSATRITGKVTSIGAIKVGDQVSAQITQGNGGQPTVAALQDPAQAPSGGGLP
jgi:hypothetical protein